MHKSLATVVLAVAVAATSCGEGKEKKAEQPTSKPTTTAPAARADATAPDTVAEHMREHFTRVRAIRDAVIAGDYAKTREPAKWLGEHGAPKGIPDPWIPLVTDFRVMAAGLDEAKDTSDLAIALGPVARSCGGCHLELKAKLQYEQPVEPPGDGFAAEMVRHKWAAQLLWDGIVIPNEEAWKAGAAHFAKIELVPEKLPADKKKAKSLRELAATTMTLGSKANAAADLPARGAAYGELLATCTKCHVLLK